jgi:hypothetical protein
MKTKSLNGIALVLIAILNANAQADLFKVLAAKGSNSYRRGNSTEWKPLLAGTRLNAEDLVKVGVNCYLGLVHTPTGRTLELKQSGTYEVIEMAKKVTATKTTFSQKYLEYVASELTEGEKQDINKNHRSHSKVTGSVERALSSHNLRIFMPRTTDIVQNTVTLTWLKHKEAKIYVVTIKNMFEELLEKLETEDTTITIDISKYDLGDDKSIIWNVAIKGKEKIKSDDHNIRIIESKDLLAKIAELKSETNEETALNNLIKATFYAQNNMFNEAKACYENAIKLAPEVSEFKKMYKSYLESVGLGDLYNY